MGQQITWLRGNCFQNLDVPEESRRTFDDFLDTRLHHKDEFNQYRHLGINKKRYQATHIAGQVWINPHLALRVDRKVFESEVDSFSMLMACLTDPVVTEHLDSCFWCGHEEPTLPSDFTPDLTLFVVAAFVRELHNLSKRHLRRAFFPVEKNLQGKFKGKLLFQSHLRSNICRGMPDRAFCRFQVHTHDTPLNQILFAALEQARRYLHRIGAHGTCLWAWINQISTSLSGVTLRRIHPAEFGSLRLTGLLKPYEKPVSLARQVLFLLGSDPWKEELNEPSWLPPFAIDLNKLFERFCEVKLRHVYTDLETPGNLGFSFRVRPDFLLPSQKTILDAKFKPYWLSRLKKFEEGADGSGERRDIYQVLAYSRHEGVIRHLKGEVESVIILLPSLSGAHTVSLEEAERIFANDLKTPSLKVLNIPIPLRN